MATNALCLHGSCDFARLNCEVRRQRRPTWVLVLLLGYIASYKVPAGGLAHFSRAAGFMDGRQAWNSRFLPI